MILGGAEIYREGSLAGARRGIELTEVSWRVRRATSPMPAFGSEWHEINREDQGNFRMGLRYSYVTLDRDTSASV